MTSLNTPLGPAPDILQKPKSPRQNHSASGFSLNLPKFILSFYAATEPMILFNVALRRIALLVSSGLPR